MADYSETVNDIDGLLVNAWRAIAADPDAVAEAASWPVAESDLSARHLALVKWRAEGGAERLAGDPGFYNSKMAGWWIWGQSCWIGSGWCSGKGPWIVGADGRITKRDGCGEGVSRRRPHISNNGQGVNRPQAREPGVGDYHPMTMPELRRWMRFLSARLRHVRILNGDWTRAVTGGALKSLSVRQGKGHAGIFLDPPYGDVRDADIYAHDDLDVAAAVQKWCIENGNDALHRIVLAGFDSEHEVLESHGWRVVEWYRAGFLKGGMANVGGTGGQQHRERLWLSPHCLQEPEQRSLF